VILMIVLVMLLDVWVLAIMELAIMMLSEKPNGLAGSTGSADSTVSAGRTGWAPALLVVILPFCYHAPLSRSHEFPSEPSQCQRVHDPDEGFMHSLARA
jgi:hypothetical protein